MNLEDIRQRLTGDFIPFVMRTSYGHEYPVRHPKFVMVGPRSIAVVDKSGEIATLDPLDIVALKDLSPKKNGLSKH